MTCIKPHPMHDEDVRARCHDRELRFRVYAGFKTNLAFIRDSRIEGNAWSNIVTGLIKRGVAGATIHRLLAWIRTPRLGAWELDSGEPTWIVKIGTGKGLRSSDDKARNTASFTALPSRMAAPSITQPPESFVGDEPDLQAISSRLSDDKLRQEYADLSKTIRDAIAAMVNTYAFERSLKMEFAREMANRGITDVSFDPEDVLR